MQNQYILEIEDATKTFPGVKALDKVTVSIKRGAVHGIVGENGAGKSTLMKILSGVYKADKAKIIFDGKEMDISTPMESMQLGLSVIYQEFNLVDLMSVGENIFLGRFDEAGNMKEIHRRSREILSRIGCDIDTHTLVGDLSVSHKQIVEIAKALSFDAKLIIMDEPSTALTNDEMKHLKNLINELRNNGITIIYISHKLDEIFELCDQVTVMRDGKVIDTRDIGNLKREEMISMMVGRTIDTEFPPRPDCATTVLLEVSNLRTRKLKNISFNIKAGEILGLVGLVGSGRTEIARALFGADRKISGDIYIEGKHVSINNPIDAINNGIGFVTEDRKQQGLFMKFSVLDNIIASSLESISKCGFINNYKGTEIAKRHKDRLRIKTPKLRTKVLNLSGGNQQKCIIARWLEMKSKVLILDEPTRGIDVGTKYEFYILMKEIVENGNSVILISSELPEVLNMSNRCLAISNGSIVGEYDPRKDTAEEIMRNILV